MPAINCIHETILWIVEQQVRAPEIEPIDNLS